MTKDFFGVKSRMMILVRRLCQRLLKKKLVEIVKMGSIVANVNDIYATVKQRKFIVSKYTMGPCV